MSYIKFSRFLRYPALIIYSKPKSFFCCSVKVTFSNWQSVKVTFSYFMVVKSMFLKIHFSNLVSNISAFFKLSSINSHASKSVFIIFTFSKSHSK